MEDLGSEVARQSEREVGRQAKSSQSSQPNPNLDYGRTGKPVVCTQRVAHHSQEIETRSFREEVVRYDRTVKFAVCRQEGAFQTRFSRDSTNSMWKTKQIPIERGNLLFAVVQITSAQC